MRPTTTCAALTVLLLALASAAGAQTDSTVADWNRHYLSGQLRWKPANPVPVSPANNATNVPVTTLLTIDTQGAAAMDVYLGACSSPPRVGIAVPVVPYKPAAPLLPNTQYCWKVTVINPAGTVTSAVWRFTTAAGTPPVNQPPVVTIAAVPPVTLPGGTTLNGSSTDDGLPNPPAAVTYAWTKDSGPGSVVFSTPAAPSTGLNFSGGLPGTYVLRLTVSDSALSGSATVSVVVNPPSANPTLALTYVGKTRDVVGPTEGAGTDGQPDGEFLLALSATATITQIRFDTNGSSGNGTYDTVPGNGTWRLGAALTPTGALLNAADSSIPPTAAQALSAFVTDSGYLTAGTTVTAAVTLSTGAVLTSSVVLSGGGPPACDPDPDPALNCIKNPTMAVWGPSPDDAIVTAYNWVATCTDGTLIPVDLGRPPVGSDGTMTKAIPALAALPPNVICTSAVTAMCQVDPDKCPTGSSAPAISNRFMRTP